VKCLTLYPTERKVSRLSDIQNHNRVAYILAMLTMHRLCRWPYRDDRRLDVAQLSGFSSSQIGGHIFGHCT
jgi:hypothetical protein